MVAACSITFAQAQNKKYDSWLKKTHVFQNLDVSVTAGTTGIGFDVASKIGDVVQLRAGYEFMPRFNKSVYFPVEVGGEPAELYDANGNRVESKFDRLSQTLKSFTSYTVDSEVEMIGKPTINNFKFLVDVFPFKENKHWHFTAGFYWGPSKFAEAVNSTEAMTSLLGVGIYNSFYEGVLEESKTGKPVMSLNIGGVPFNVEFDPEQQQSVLSNGRMGFRVGDRKDTGEPYLMEPDENGMVKVTAKSNSFKPYLGFGYGGRLVKGRDDWHVSVDAGAMFWGGTPDLYTHDGTNLTKDVQNITGKVGDWVDFIGGVKVYPVLSVRLTKSIF